MRRFAYLRHKKNTPGQARRPAQRGLSAALRAFYAYLDLESQSACAVADCAWGVGQPTAAVARVCLGCGGTMLGRVDTDRLPLYRQRQAQGRQATGWTVADSARGCRCGPRSRVTLRRTFPQSPTSGFPSVPGLDRVTEVAGMTGRGQVGLAVVVFVLDVVYLGRFADAACSPELAVIAVPVQDSLADQVPIPRQLGPSIRAGPAARL
jgi:hypothetical protein